MAHDWEQKSMESLNNGINISVARSHSSVVLTEHTKNRNETEPAINSISVELI